ncbi:MAG: hypothetical protein AAF226_06035, partial [Verrucomicrobiota bacterium]
MSLGKRFTDLAKAKLKQDFGDWDDLLRPRRIEDYFFGHQDVPHPMGFSTERCDREAWWLANLCRLAYTPDRKEEGRPFAHNKVERRLVLDAVDAPYIEQASIHKTGNHASVYVSTSDGPTVLCFR